MRALMVALVLALTWVAPQDASARTLLRLELPNPGGVEEVSPPEQRFLDYRSVGLLERLDLSEPADSAQWVLSEIAGALRSGADETWAWWRGYGTQGQPSDLEQQAGVPSTLLSTVLGSTPSQPTQAQPFLAEDPFEPINRLVFDLNSGIQLYILNPFTDAYNNYTSRQVRRSVLNFFRNLREPVTVVSSALVGDFVNAGNATARFGINTTLGVAGFFDPATDMGFAPRPRDLEEMLCQFGLPSGPYVVVPLLGPATARDAVARLATVAAYVQVMGAVVYLPYRFSHLAVNYADAREHVEDKNAEATDAYLVHRSLYIASRNKDCSAPETL